MNLLINFQKPCSMAATQLKIWTLQDLETFQLSFFLSMEQINKMLNILEEYVRISDDFVLVLRVEIRLHVVYFLEHALADASYDLKDESLEPDQNIIKLNAALSCFERIMEKNLEELDCLFVFEGVSVMIVNLLIGNAKLIKSMNKPGAEKMVKNIIALHQNMQNIAFCSESKVDHARKYYEMFFVNPRHIIQSLKTNLMFKQQEYICLLELQFDVKNLKNTKKAMANIKTFQAAVESVNDFFIK